MDITCKRCGTSIVADDINLQAMAAKCRSCNAVFSIADQVTPESGSAPSAILDVPLPKRFTVERPGSALRISWRWFTLSALILVAFAVFWNGFLCVWVTTAIAIGGGSFPLFVSFHILVGIGMAYYALTMVVNTTTVEASYGALSVRQGPLPAFGNRDLPRDAIRQLYCLERVKRSRRGSSVTYELHAAKADGSSISLVTGLESTEQALYLEQELERFLGVADQPVRGELRK